MHFYDPIYSNTIGTTSLIKENEHEVTGSEKIQLLLGDAAIILESKDLKSVLNTVITSQQGCDCEKCQNSQQPKFIKFDTVYTTLLFKSSETNIFALEDLLRGTIFELEFSAILDSNNIPT
ncbi:hypothetical protein KO500_07865 [Cellulophaga baltica]|uniref:hypothetical protein n=1 Tax=Cellulophaga TaxID=104264 RepID=UPI001C074462|nr:MULTISPECIES: hypothetical protein [Cellulophaga]MBU2996346.1 hypothetical protein [Cellulophaga baltica]MDO6767742.1 hypothetical protein [Cellulophaga sp. 1_MG-2023]